MALSQKFSCHITLLSPLSFLFVCSFFVFFVAIVLLFCCLVAFRFQVHNERMGLPQINWFSYGENFDRIQFCKGGPTYVACNSFCKYLAIQPHAKFVLFWQNYEILRGFNFEKLLKVPKFSNLLNGKIISIEVNC